MAWQLSTGAIEAIMTGQTFDNPVFQVLGQKKIAGSGAQGADRYRLLLSDGRHSHSSAMLATQLNDKITNGDLDNFSVIRLDRYLCNQIQQDRRVMILLEITVLGRGGEVVDKLGNPVPFKASGGAGGADQPTQANGTYERYISTTYSGQIYACPRCKNIYRHKEDLSSHTAEAHFLLLSWRSNVGEGSCT